MSVMTSSWVGPTQKSRSWRSLKRSSSGPNLSHLPDSTHNSAGMAAGIRTSSAPARSISSRTMFSTLRRVRNPSGIQVYNPAASLRMRPARSMSCWLTTSASAGVSLVVLTGYWDQRIGRGSVSGGGFAYDAGRDARPQDDREFAAGIARGVAAESAEPRHLSFAQPAHDRLPVLGLLFHRRGHRPQLRAGR